jgi:hypothetical protein
MLSTSEASATMPEFFFLFNITRPLFKACQTCTIKSRKSPIWVRTASTHGITEPSYVGILNKHQFSFSFRPLVLQGTPKGVFPKSMAQL